ncbi:hypothetical protein DFP72DRAFT_863040 [Ephemerocybe angulata]|uniref:Uncharacterized protein n=1 Tax=Ephemerocybe angulata TaxID=980116 RepID=A0A8H6H7U7_9AGAR|nr:hypothetical protein DFP72DRAFT_863040 [Tulosesus angulatus]
MSPPPPPSNSPPPSPLDKAIWVQIYISDNRYRNGVDPISAVANRNAVGNRSGSDMQHSTEMRANMYSGFMLRFIDFSYEKTSVAALSKGRSERGIEIWVRQGAPALEPKATRGSARSSVGRGGRIPLGEAVKWRGRQMVILAGRGRHFVETSDGQLARPLAWLWRSNFAGQAMGGVVVAQDGLHASMPWLGGVEGRSEGVSKNADGSRYGGAHSTTKKPNPLVDGMVPFARLGRHRPRPPLPIGDLYRLGLRDGSGQLFWAGHTVPCLGYCTSLLRDTFTGTGVPVIDMEMKVGYTDINIPRE